MALKTPILFLVFNRLETTKQVFEKIKEQKPEKLYIAADGPRENKIGETKKVSVVRDFILENINWKCEIKTLFREKNLGCKYAPSSAITWFFENEEMGIILEDDCLPAKSFFSFCETMLTRYKNDFSVWHIGGNNFQNEIQRGDGDYYFSLYNHTWGWASWRNRWKYYDVELGNIKDDTFIDKLFTHENEIKYWKNIFARMKKKEIDTWDAQWTFACWYNNRKSISPNVNLVSNIGFGEDATHTYNTESTMANRKTRELVSFKTPSSGTINREADIYTSQNVFLYKTPFIKRIINKLKKVMYHEKM